MKNATRAVRFRKQLLPVRSPSPDSVSAQATPVLLCDVFLWHVVIVRREGSLRSAVGMESQLQLQLPLPPLSVWALPAFCTVESCLCLPAFCTVESRLCRASALCYQMLPLPLVSLNLESQLTNDRSKPIVATVSQCIFTDMSILVQLVKRHFIFHP